MPFAWAERNWVHSSRQPLMLGCRCETCRKPLATPTHGPRCVTTGPGCPWTATPRTSCLPTSLALPADHPDILGAGRYLLAPRGQGSGDHTESASCVVEEETERRSRTTTVALTKTAQAPTRALAVGEHPRRRAV